MRNEITDEIASMTQDAFKKSKLIVPDFIKKMANCDIVFDVQSMGYHLLYGGEIVYVYFAGGQWNAKY